MVLKLFVVFLGLGIYFAQAQEVVDKDVEAVSQVQAPPQPQDRNRYLPGQTWQPWAQEQMRGQGYLPGQTWQPWAQNTPNHYLPGQTWQPWAQPPTHNHPRNRHLGGQVWQPWAQNQFLAGQTWQPWAQPHLAQPHKHQHNRPQAWQQPWAQPARNQVESRPAKLVQYPGNVNNIQPDYSNKMGDVGVFPMESTWSNMPSTDPVWNMATEAYPTPEKEANMVEKDAVSHDPRKFVPGPPTWRKSWTPMPGKKPGCFNRCKNRCGKGFGNEYGCKPSCRSGCNLKPNCGSKAGGKMVGNTMVCPFSKQNNNNMVNNYLPGQTWQPWAQPMNQPNYMTNYDINTGKPFEQLSASVEVNDLEASAEITQDNVALVDQDLNMEE